MPATRQAHFGPELFTFLKALAKNNDRGWFLEHKERYERDVRDPLLRFIGDFAPHLEKITERYVADPRPSGGSMFRLHRDTRFSKDKQPYKTHVAAQFRHSAGKDVHSPGFYLHLEPGRVFLGGGLWHPEVEVLAKVRNAVAEDGKAFVRSISGKAFCERFQLGGESLARPPRGFDPEHPLIEHLKRKDFVAMASLSEADAIRPDFLATFMEHCRALAPMMRFLTEALGLKW